MFAFAGDHVDPLRLTWPGPELVADKSSANVPSSGSLVYLHGGQTRHSWACTCRRLALTGWDGLAYDARGHGDSGWDVDADYRIDAFIGDLRRVISASSDVPVLVGASMGGMAALIAQGQDATTSRALVLVDVVPSFESRGSSEVFEFLNSGIDGFADIQDAVEAIKAYGPTRGAMIGDRIERVLRWRCDRGTGVGIPIWSPIRPISPLGPARRQMRRREHPSMPTWIDSKHAPALPQRRSPCRFCSFVAPSRQRLIPHAWRSDIADAGHVITGTDNDRLCAELGDFLNSLDRVR